jgi:hypothetical protein
MNVRFVSRRAALITITLIVMTATLIAFVESYDGLYRFAISHGLSGVWASVWPAQVDAFIIIGELTIFVGIVDRFDTRGKILAWMATLGGTLVSVTGNVLHVGAAHAHDPVWLATAGVPPIAATAGLMIGLQVLKRVIHAGGIASVPLAVTIAAPSGTFALRPLSWTLRQAPESLADKIDSEPGPIHLVRTPEPAPSIPARPAAITAGSSDKYSRALRILHAASGGMSGRELAQAMGQANRTIPNKVIKDYQAGVRP